MQENINLKPYTYFKIGGPARFFADARTEDELRNTVKFASARSLPIFVMGAASNILVSDRGFPGVVIRILLRDIERNGSVLKVGAGVQNAIVAARAIKEGLTGLEWIAGIPGTIGGSVRGNAGCFGGEMKDVVKSVRYLDANDGEVKTGDNAFCEFKYRESVFKNKQNFIILSADLGLRPGDPGMSQRMIRRYTSLRFGTQDIGSASAACVFKNVSWPDGDAAKEAFISRYPEVAEFRSSPAIPAAFLIDHLGFKGKHVGGACVSEKHANFIINKGNATSEEVVMLIGMIKEHIYRKYNLRLEEEVQYVGF